MGAAMSWRWRCAAGVEAGALFDHTGDLGTPPEAKLPADGRVYHYAPLDFMQWLNDRTWSSEWPKYRVTTGRPPASVARPAAPRPRRL